MTAIVITVMTAASLRGTCAAAIVRDRVMEGVARLLAAGDDLTFAKVAAEAAVPERTVYRHFPTREAFLADLPEATGGSASTARCGLQVEATALARGLRPASTRSRR